MLAAVSVQVAHSWTPPSPRVAELIRTGASLMLAAADRAVEEVDEAVFAAAQSPIYEDPVFAASVRRQNRANLVRWAEANAREPGAPVPADPGPEALATARDMVRRGLDAEALQGYRIGQNVAWQRWMALAFELTQDPDELRELLEVSARSIFAYVDDVIARLAEQIEWERDQLTHGTHAQRLEVVSLIIEGAPMDARRASARLQYELERPHTGAIVWTDHPELDPAALEQAAEAVGRTAGTRPLTVLASARSLWVWVAGSSGPDAAALDAALAESPSVRVALGPTAAGVEGFRRSHVDALATQRLMARSPQPRLARYEDVQVVALATADEERAQEFVTRTLGELATAPAELRETLRVYLREGSNAASAARALFTHRNTVLKRLDRAQAMLPQPLDGRVLPVALALDIVHWREG
jgi:DNA-binding PucR family transcriptional regulator